MNAIAQAAVEFETATRSYALAADAEKTMLANVSYWARGRVENQISRDAEDARMNMNIAGRRVEKLTGWKKTA